MKSKLLICLIILTLLFSVASVSAEDNQTETISDSPQYHPFSELNQASLKAQAKLNWNMIIHVTIVQ